MKFLELNIENFLVLTKATVNLSDRGLVLVQGVNNADSSADSNGAGKSSLADALCWVIYGTTARGESGDAVVNNKAKKNTRVEVKIMDDMTIYRIVRHRKHKQNKNSLHVFADDGYGEKDLTKGTDKLTQDIVDKIIGASLDVFSGSIYAGQERMPDLPNMTDKILKMLIEEAAGITALEDAYKQARMNALAASTDVATVQGEIQNLETGLQGLDRQLDDAIEREKDWFSQRNVKINDMKLHVRDELLPAAKKLAAEAPEAEIDRISNDIIAIDTKIASVGQEQSNLQALQTDVVSLGANVNTAKVKLNATIRNADVAKLNLDQANNRIGQPCPECGRQITANEMSAVISGAQTSLKNHLDEQLIVQDELEQAEEALRDAQSALSAFKQGMTDLSTEVAQRASLQAQRDILVAKDQQRRQVIAQAKSEMEQITKLQAEESPFAETISSVKKMKKKVEDGIVVKKTELALRQKKLDLETEVVRVFSPAGVRARVLDEITPYLNGQTSKYLSILSDGNISAEWSTLTPNKSGEMKERFAIDVTSPISSQTFKGLSGGEKRKVRVATALALQDLVATRATKPIDLFIGDEIDHALDASGLERLMIILDEKAKERGTVIVISHSDLKDEIKQVLTVERDASGETKIFETAA